MEFCGMKRESDRKCLNHARGHAVKPLGRSNTRSPRVTDFRLCASVTVRMLRVICDNPID